MDRVYPYPETFFQVAFIILVIGWGFLCMAGRRQVDPATLSIMRVANSAASIAVIVLVLHTAASEPKTGGWSGLLRFFAAVPHVYMRLPLVIWFSLAGLSALALASVFGLSIALKTPRPPRKLILQTLMASKIALLVVGGGLWWCGFLFVPQSWDWGDFGEGFNLAMRSYYLFAVTESITVCLLFMLPQQRPAFVQVSGNIADSKFQWDAPRRRRWWQARKR